MGLFDRFRTSYQDWQPQNREESWVAATYAFCFVDGSMSEPEFDAWARMLIMKSLFANKDIASVAEKIREVAEAIGWEETCLRACRSLDSDDAPTVFCLLCELSMGDGSLNQKERDTLDRVSKEMKMPQDLVERIVDVYMHRMRGQRKLA